jgi:hypothetical protein
MTNYKTDTAQTKQKSHKDTQTQKLHSKHLSRNLVIYQMRRNLTSKLQFLTCRRKGKSLTGLCCWGTVICDNVYLIFTQRLSANCILLYCRLWSQQTTPPSSLLSTLLEDNRKYPPHAVFQIICPQWRSYIWMMLVTWSSRITRQWASTRVAVGRRFIECCVF